MEVNNKKVNNKQINKKKAIVLVFAIVLAVTATTWCSKPSLPDLPRAPDMPGTVKNLCTEETAHYSTGCALLNAYDDAYDNNGVIGDVEYETASDNYNVGTITAEELSLVSAAYAAGSINAVCPGCYQTPSPP